MDVGTWLRGLGLGRYEPAFRDNEVDASILYRLTADDLKDMGVTAIGHRRKLLDAINALRVGGEALAPRDAEAGTAAPQAERRQLTVMFADLVGSTALSARLDPEELREVLRAYQDAVAGAVARFGGHVAKFMGDGVLAYFGWPQAHEDDAERAVRAALAVTGGVGGLRTPGGEPLATRVGIATGLVVVGDLLGKGAAREETVVGETPNLAARLQELARPGEVVIASSTRRLVGWLFDLEALGPRAFKGLAALVEAFRVVAEGRAESRFDARYGGAVTPLIGRDQELALLLDRWRLARGGEGQAVLISGEAGIGKSRLLEALRESTHGKVPTVLRYQTSPYHSNSALWPVIRQLERAAGLEREEAPEARLDRLEALLARGVADPREAAALLALLLDLDESARYPAMSLAPQQRKARTLQVLVDQLEGLAGQGPVLVVLEDMHWLDPTTRELFDLAVDRLRRLPVLLVATFRPEMSPPWTAFPHVTLITLDRLARTEAAALIDAVTGGRALPAVLAEMLLERTEGVPLFVEELTKTVLESGLLREKAERYELTGPLPPLAIPSSLHDSLLARLDRLASVKEVAQIGAVIGREFSHELLAAVAPLGDNELRDALAQLAEAELVFCRGTPPEASYVFKHALVRDAAYQSLLKSKRQQLHARITRVLEEHFPETVGTQPELLAQHCTEAGLAERAVDYWQRAGQRALARSATAEAVAQLTNGLEVLEGLSGGPERQRRELGLQLALGQASIAAKGFAAPETGRAYARARELCHKLGEISELFPALYGQSVFLRQCGELAASNEVAWELLRLAEERGDAAAAVAGHRILGANLFQLGRLSESRAHLEAGVTLYDPVRDRSSRFVYAIDSRVVCLLWLAQALLILGYPEQARVWQGEALAFARELAHPNTITYTLMGDCILHQLLRDRQEVQEQTEPLIALATEQSFPLYMGTGTVVRGWALADGGRTQDGIAVIRSGLADYRSTGAELFSPYFLALLADAHGRAGQAATGLSLAADALDGVERTGVRWIEAELQRLRGKLWLAQPEPDEREAEACFRRAIDVAQEQGARWWELCAAISLARLWRDQGKRAEVRALLAPVYGWFTEGFDTADLKEARGLLDELS